MENPVIQVLVAAMHQKDFSLIDQMNLQSDALIGNQCDFSGDEVQSRNGHRYTYYHRKDRGVGLNRNTTLMRASGDILLFADEDMIFFDRYEEIVKKAYRELPNADAVIFNLNTVGDDRGRRINRKVQKIHFYNAFNYGAARLTARRIPLQRENIFFHSSFGGGTLFSAGEDTLFILEMLRKGLKIYVYPETLASVDQSESTWFQGYDEKYYYDKGALFAAVSRKWAFLLCFQDLVRHPNYKKNSLTFWNAFKSMYKGILSFKTLTPYEKRDN